MLERAHRLGPLRLAAIAAVMLAVAGAVVRALGGDGGSESTPEVARNPAQQEPAETPPPTTDAGTDDVGTDSDDDPNPKDRGGNGAARTSEPGGENGQEPEPSSAKARKPPLENRPRGGSTEPDGGQSQPGLPPQAAKLFKDAIGGDEEPPSNLPPEIKELLEGSAGGG